MSESGRKSLLDANAYFKGAKAGMDQAINMVRVGHLRIAAHPSERGKRPYDSPLRPWAITRLAWRSWWREKRGGAGKLCEICGVSPHNPECPDA